MAAYMFALPCCSRWHVCPTFLVAADMFVLPCWWLLTCLPYLVVGRWCLPYLVGGHWHVFPTLLVAADMFALFCWVELNTIAIIWKERFFSSMTIAGCLNSLICWWSFVMITFCSMFACYSCIIGLHFQAGFTIKLRLIFLSEAPISILSITWKSYTSHIYYLYEYLSELGLLVAALCF